MKAWVWDDPATLPPVAARQWSPGEAETSKTCMDGVLIAGLPFPYFCTDDPGHDGDHEAGTYGHLLAKSWPEAGFDPSKLYAVARWSK